MPVVVCVYMKCTQSYGDMAVNNGQGKCQGEEKTTGQTIESRTKIYRQQIVGPGKHHE